jgi:hypothetical protein
MAPGQQQLTDQPPEHLLVDVCKRYRAPLGCAALGCEQTRRRETLDRLQGSSLRPSVVRSARLP